MNINELGEVTNRKKIYENAEKIRDKVNRENAKILKMKVAQDTSYWDMKEKLLQVEGNLERLQQNMVELQMQYETVSMKYQDELRLRSDTLNKVASVKALVDVLEECLSKVSDTLCRTRSDCSALADAYASASCTVRELHERYLQLQRTKSDETRDISVRFLEELAAKSTSETCAIMNRVGDVLRNQQSELHQKNEEKISELQSEVKRLTEELNAQKCNFQSIVANYEIKAVEEARRADELRANALTTEKCMTMLREQIASGERERILLQQHLDDTKRKLQESELTVEELNTSLTDVNKKNEKFAETIAEKNQVIGEQQECIDKLSNEMAALNIKYVETDAALTAVKLQKQAEIDKIEKMNEESSTLKKQLSDIEEEFKKQKEENERNAASTRNIITGLMGEVQAAARAADGMKTEIHTLKANAAAEQDSLRQEEARQRARADNLDITVKNKDKEIVEMKTTIQEKDKEIECLKNKIRAMQNTIDNIQMELTTRLYVGSSERDKRSECPERDQQPKITKRDEFDVYSFLSNGSSDSDTLPMTVVKQQFDALAKRARESLTDGKPGAGADGYNAEGEIVTGSGMIHGTGATGARHGQPPMSVSRNTKKRTIFKSKNNPVNGKKLK